MYGNFQVAAGTIPGRRHVGSGNLLVGKNNQDAYAVASNDHCVVATVFDGCSSANHAEVGAKIASAIIPDLVMAAATDVKYDTAALTAEPFWDSVKRDALTRFQSIVNCIPKGDSVVLDHFLFTVLGVIVTADAAVMFSLGDGVYCVDGALHRIGPFPDNAPPYLCYELLSHRQKFEVREVRFEESLLIGTDGVLDLIEKYDLKEFWSNEMLFGPTFTESLTPWLRTLNSEVVTFSENGFRRKYGILPDDTTLIAIRRQEVQYAHLS